MKMLSRIIFLFLVCFLGWTKAAKTMSVTYDDLTKKYTLHHGIPKDNDIYIIAEAIFQDDIFLSGWSYLEVYTYSYEGLFNDSQQVYSAGIVEGGITSDLITKQRKNRLDNYCVNEVEYCQRLKRFLEKNLEFLNQQIQDHDSDPYWHQIKLILEQISGLHDGYYDVRGYPRTQVDPFGMMMLFNIFGDLEDLEGVLNRTASTKVTGSGSCSALIKLLPGNADLYVAHDTWNSYNSMLRIQKMYDFQIHMKPQEKKQNEIFIPGRAMSFSSYPGCIFSGDDFYLLSSGLAALETTIGNNNKDLWKSITPASVFDWMRNIVANRLATSGWEWVKLFRQQNSGTYNNQWMVVDYKLFHPGQPIAENLLWVLEQLPGMTVVADVSDVLKEQEYWPSYNSPYFPLIFNNSGTQELVKRYGDWFTYDKTPRALIFKRDHSKVVDIASMTKLMRYNDFQHDPLSRCNCTPAYSAENAISARSDLNNPNGTYPFSALSYRAHGGTDMKLTNADLFKKLQFVAISGPTADNVPPFQWSKAGFEKTEPHEGHPDLWNFQPVLYQWINDTNHV